MNETRHPRSRGCRVYAARITLCWSNSCNGLHVYAAKLTNAECAQCSDQRKKKMNAKRIKSISFRLTEEEYGEIDKAAAAGDEPNNWCRQLALTAALEGPLFGKTGRQIYTELAILRFLIGHGFKLLFSRNAGEATAWTKLRRKPIKGQMISFGSCCRYSPTSCGDSCLNLLTTFFISQS